MKFTERSFIQSMTSRPRPITHWNESLGLLIVATPWGKDIAKEEFIQKIEDYITSAQVDSELTSPYQSLQTYDKTSNIVRTSIMVANDYILKQQNKSELTSGFELFIGYLQNGIFYFANFGHPHVLLSRSGKTIMPLYFDIDHSMSLNSKGTLACLPSNILGVSEQIEVKIFNLKLNNGDKIILLSHSWLPEPLVTTNTKKLAFDNIVKSLMSEKNQPFWIGMLEYSKLNENIA